MSYAMLQGVLFNATRAAREMPEIARAALAELDDIVWDGAGYDTACVARLFLEAVISGRALFAGTKGDVCMWSTIGNHGSGAYLRDHLLPFFKRVCEQTAPVRGDIGNPYAPQILVFEAGEQEYGCVRGWSLRLDRDGTFNVREVKLDFPFNGDA